MSCKSHDFLLFHTTVSACFIGERISALGSFEVGEDILFGSSRHTHCLLLVKISRSSKWITSFLGNSLRRLLQLGGCFLALEKWVLLFLGSWSLFHLHFFLTILGWSLLLNGGLWISELCLIWCLRCWCNILVLLSSCGHFLSKGLMGLNEASLLFVLDVGGDLVCEAVVL